jgi:hypothetical protein
MICSSNAFIINNPDPNPDPKLRLKQDPNLKKIILDPQHGLGVKKPSLKFHYDILVQSNGLVERYHHCLKEALRSRLAGADWSQHLPWVLLGLRAAP